MCGPGKPYVVGMKCWGCLVPTTRIIKPDFLLFILIFNHEGTFFDLHKEIRL